MQAPVSILWLDTLEKTRCEETSFELTGTRSLSSVPPLPSLLRFHHGAGVDKQDKMLPAWCGGARGEKIEPDAVSGYAYVWWCIISTITISTCKCIDEASFFCEQFDPLLHLTPSHTRSHKCSGCAPSRDGLCCNDVKWNDRLKSPQATQLQHCPEINAEWK